MAQKKCATCGALAAKMVDDKLYCDRCLLIVDKDKDVKHPCNCGCKMIEEPKKKSFWEKIFGYGQYPHYM